MTQNIKYAEAESVANFLVQEIFIKYKSFKLLLSNNKTKLSTRVVKNFYKNFKFNMDIQVHTISETMRKSRISTELWMIYYQSIKRINE